MQAHIPPDRQRLLAINSETPFGASGGESVTDEENKQNENMTHTHTPRPWDQLGCAIYAGEIPIAGIVGITWDRMVENQANLNLISAAPDMLEALQMLMPQEPREADSYDRAMWDNARAAIAKAIGKEEA